jgi:hypothetical protein
MEAGNRATSGKSSEGKRMEETGVFIIQREDGLWYAARRSEDTPLWVAERERAHRFDAYPDAWEVYLWLQQQGHRVRLFAIP